MNKRVISIISAFALMLACIPVLAAEGDVSYSLDLTALTSDDFNSTGYTAVNDYVKIKAAPGNITTTGVLASKNNGTRIEITVPSDGELTVSLTGSAVLPDYENRKGGETTLTSDEAVTVYGGKKYYLQGSGSNAASVTAVAYTAKAIEPTQTQAPTPTPSSSPTAAPAATQAPPADGIWDLTGLTASNFNNDRYTAVDKIISIKADPANITSDGVKVTKNSGGAFIRIIPESNGELTVSFTGSGVIFTDYEKRTGKEDNLVPNEPVAVIGGVPYYIQGSSGTAVAIKSISFTKTEYSLFTVTGIGFNESYTKVVEFDIEKGDDYENDVLAIVCVYDPIGRLKKTGTKKIFAKTLLMGSNTVKCDIDISGYDAENDVVKIFLWSGIDSYSFPNG